MRYTTEFINGHALIYNAEETHDIVVNIVKLELSSPDVEFNASTKTAEDFYGNKLMDFFSETKGTIKFDLIPIRNNEIVWKYTFKNIDEFNGFKKAFNGIMK